MLTIASSFLIITTGFSLVIAQNCPALTSNGHAASLGHVRLSALLPASAQMQSYLVRPVQQCIVQCDLEQARFAALGDGGVLCVCSSTYDPSQNISPDASGNYPAGIFEVYPTDYFARTTNSPSFGTPGVEGGPGSGSVSVNGNGNGGSTSGGGAGPSPSAPFMPFGTGGGPFTTSGSSGAAGGGPPGENSPSNTGGMPTSPTPYTYAGCYSEPLPHDGTIRALTGFSSTGLANLTVNICVNLCAGLGYPLAGLEAGDECYCGSALNGVTQSSGCNDPCSGNQTEVCGGTFLFSLYASPSILGSLMPSGTPTITASNILSLSLTSTSITSTPTPVRRAEETSAAFGARHGRTWGFRGYYY